MTDLVPPRIDRAAAAELAELTKDRSMREEVGHFTKFSLKDVKRADLQIRMSGVLTQLDEWVETDTTKTGPGGVDAYITARHVMIAFLLLAKETTPLLVGNARDVLAYRLPLKARRYLELPPAPKHLDDDQEAKNWYNNVYNALRRILARVDPYPSYERRNFKGRAEREKLVKEYDRDLYRLRKDRLDWFSNQLLEMTWQTLSPEIRSRRTRTDMTVDQTPVASYSRRGRAKMDPKTQRERKDTPVLEPETNWYHMNAAYRGTDKGQKSEFINGFAGNMGVLTSFFEEEGDPIPQLIMTYSLSTPNKNVDIELVRLARSMLDRNHEPGVVAADRDYWAHKRIERLHVPMRKMGWLPLTDYRSDSLGPQESSEAGELNLLGRHLCPGTPSHLVTVAQDARSKRITEATFDKRIVELQSYSLRVKESFPDGREKKMCPAHGPQATVECGLRERIEDAKYTDPLQRERMRIKSGKWKPRVRRADEPEDPPTVCTQTSVTFKLKDGLKLAQPLQWGTKEWHKSYKATRNGSEGFNAYAKDPGFSNLKESGHRRMRGIAAQQFLTTFQLVATNFRVIMAFIRAEKERAKHAAAGTTPMKRRRKRDETGRSKYTRPGFGLVDLVPDPEPEAPLDEFAPLEVIPEYEDGHDQSDADHDQGPPPA